MPIISIDMNLIIIFSCQVFCLFKNFNILLMEISSTTHHHVIAQSCSLSSFAYFFSGVCKIFLREFSFFGDHPLCEIKIHGLFFFVFP